MRTLTRELDPLDLTGLSDGAVRDVQRRLADGSWRAWSDAASNVGFCACPVRLHGRSVTIDRTTGETLGSFSSADAPMGVLHVRCGNRRADVCPSCSRIYARDTFAMVKAGVAGGKTVPESVAANPLLFVTLTAPSFGAVHTARNPAGPCRSRSAASRCPHGTPTSCRLIHDPDSPLMGAPICPACYDAASAVIWQWWAPELWRRFTITLRRLLARTLGVGESRLGRVASLQYAKVAEFQHRGLVHFHALIRLDGPAADGIGSPAALDASSLAAVVRAAVPMVEVLAPAVDDDDRPRRLAFGKQVDVRVVRAGQRTDDPTGPLVPGQVAGYLAKYATKDAGHVTGHGQRRAHIEALHRVCRDLAERAVEADGVASPYALMGKWSHMLGFRGHFSTKSRRYSITLGSLRRARARWQALAAQSRRTGEPIDLEELEAQLLADDQDETTLVIGDWTYVGSGWQTAGDHALALAAAARAREYAQVRAEKRRRDHQQRTQEGCGDERGDNQRGASAGAARGR
jgi:hypothetical protein